MANNKDSADMDKMVLNGDKVSCPYCGQILLYQKAESVKHPSILYPSGDYHVRVNINRSSIFINCGIKTGLLRLKGFKENEGRKKPKPMLE